MVDERFLYDSLHVDEALSNDDIESAHDEIGVVKIILTCFIGDALCSDLESELKLANILTRDVPGKATSGSVM